NAGYLSSRAVTLTEERRASNRHSSEGTSVPPVKVHQCQLSVLIHDTCQCLPVHINATYRVHLSCLSVSPISATYQCQSVLPISVHQCCLSVPVSATYQ
ncbi:unnamed protein product, partial [Staurois parvus]